jgi:hypothetical protein
MKIYKNYTNNDAQITIPVEYDEDGNPTRYKTHTLKRSEIIEFNDEKDNTNTIINECLNKNLTQK